MKVLIGFVVGVIVTCVVFLFNFNAQVKMSQLDQRSLVHSDILKYGLEPVQNNFVNLELPIMLCESVKAYDNMLVLPDSGYEIILEAGFNQLSIVTENRSKYCDAQP